MAQDPKAAKQEHRVDIIDLDWDHLPFASEAERLKVQDFEKYLTDARGFDGKTLKPFEMATFYLGNESNNEIGAKKYIDFLKFRKDYKFDTVSKESLLKSMTLLKQAYGLGGTITKESNIKKKHLNGGSSHNTVQRKCFIFGSVGRAIFPGKFDSVYSMVKGLYYIWNEFNYLTNFELSRNYLIIVTDLSGLGMKNFSITVQRAAANMMQYIYPVTIDTIYLTDAPWMMNAVVGLVVKLIDTNNISLKQTTKVDAFKELGDESKIPIIIGGKYDYTKELNNDGTDSNKDDEKGKDQNDGADNSNNNNNNINNNNNNNANDKDKKDDDESKNEKEKLKANDDDTKSA